MSANFQSGREAIASRISDEYVRLQRELHAKPHDYGARGYKWAQTVIYLVKRLDAWSVLDYGCGAGSLKTRLRELQLSPGVRVHEYDPAIKGKDGHPVFADLVVCTDVLEHVEPDKLSAVLDHLRTLARKAVFFVIALDPANKILSDGRNAHLILESPEWWNARIAAAGFESWPDNIMADVPLPTQFYNPAKRSKRLIGVGVPQR